jgi:hypothetical protein
MGVNASLAAIRGLKEEQRERARALAASTSNSLRAVLEAMREAREESTAAIQALREEVVSTEACIAELSDRTWAALRVHQRCLGLLAVIALAEAAAIVWLGVR